MPYGSLKTDTLIYYTATGDINIPVSGILYSGVPISSVSGIFTTVTGTTGNFVTLSGTTITGATGNFVTLSGTTITGTTGNFTSVIGTTISGATVTGGIVNDNIGNVRNIPQNSQTTSYTLVSGDAGKHIFTTSGVTVPSGVFVVGQAISIYNNTTGNITITQGTNVTLRQAGTSGTGNRTLAQRGLATLLCVSGSNGTEFVVGGNVT